MVRDCRPYSLSNGTSSAQRSLKNRRSNRAKLKDKSSWLNALPKMARSCVCAEGGVVDMGLHGRAHLSVHGVPGAAPAAQRSPHAYHLRRRCRGLGRVWCIVASSSGGLRCKGHRRRVRLPKPKNDWNWTRQLYAQKWVVDRLKWLSLKATVPCIVLCGYLYKPCFTQSCGARRGFLGRLFSPKPKSYLS